MFVVELFVSFIDGSDRPLVVVTGDNRKDTLANVLDSALVGELMSGAKKIRERDGAVITWDVLSTSSLDSMPTNLEIGNPDMEDGPEAPESLYTVLDCPNPNCKAKKEHTFKDGKFRGQTMSMHNNAQMRECREYRESAARGTDKNYLDSRTELEVGALDEG